MNMEKLADILADPAELTELQRCTSVRELVARLNKAGAACTREEGICFLRVMESVAEDDEAAALADEDKPARKTRRAGGLLPLLFRRGADGKRKDALHEKKGTLNIDSILHRMNRSQ